MKIAQVLGDHQVLFSSKLIDTRYSVPLIAYILTEELVKRGHEVTVFVTSDSKTSAKIAPGWFPSTDSRFRKYKVGSKERTELFKKYCQNVIEQSDQFDVVHIHDPFLTTLKFLKNVKAPLLVTFHKHRLYKKEKKYSNANFVAISQNQIKINTGVKFVGMVYNGIPIEKFPFNLKPNDYLFWLGRLSPSKGALEAIEVANRIKKRLILAGPLDISPRYKKYAKKVLKEMAKSKYLKFLGEIKNFQKKCDLYKNALAFLFPLKWEEPFGLVMVEAMACGTPVIAFNRGAVPEIVRDGKTGFIVENVYQMSKTVEKISLISRKNCREWVEKNFTAKKMAISYEKIYKKVIKEWKRKN